MTEKNIQDEPEFQELMELMDNMDAAERQRTIQHLKEKSSPVLSTEEAADYLNIHKNTLLKFTQNGLIPAKRIGRQWRYHRDLLDEWMRESE